MDKAAIITAVTQYDRKLENGEDLENGPIAQKLFERTKELREKLNPSK